MVRFVDKQWLRLAALLLTGVVAVGFVWKNWGTFMQGVQIMRELPATFFWLAIPLVLLTFILAACAYFFLALQPVKLRELIFIELAAAFATRLVPSGIGGIGVHGLFLRRRKHSLAELTAVVSTNNALGIVVHIALLVLALTMGSAERIQLQWHVSYGLGLLGFVVLLVALSVVRPIRGRLQSFGRNFLASLQKYTRHPHKLLYAALALVALTLVNLLTLYVAAYSFGVSFDIPSLFLVYTAGVFVGAAVPTPGGLAGVETGLAAGFVACGVAGATAVAIALAFRLVVYWLPIVPGAAVLYIARKRGML
ncbi:hypothetical protein CSA80_01525 [Candidatus Saccharibacteria bacterium]|nr:MAG: hypothetical protein CSA80_01525 [Candidatus Saccharibacteria bacterium]